MKDCKRSFSPKAAVFAMQDFYNLVDVYLDAVLHPKCIEDERTFAQEGWHYELEDPKVTSQSIILLMTYN